MALRFTPVSVLVTVTLAPGTLAPEGSVIWPVSSAVWAKAAAAAPHNRVRVRKVFNFESRHVEYRPASVLASWLHRPAAALFFAGETLQGPARYVGHDAPVSIRARGKRSMPGVVVDNELADVLLRAPHHLGVSKHGVAGRAASAVVIHRDPQLLVRRERSPFPGEAANALAFGLGEIDLIVDSLGHVEVVADDAGVGQRALGAGLAAAREKIARGIFE